MTPDEAAAHLVVRHASAGERASWTGDDTERPLDDRGRRQALALVESLREFDVRHVFSSPYARCAQTVEPLAERLGLDVRLTEHLAEGAASGEVYGLLAKLDEPAVLCTHGDVLEALFGKKGKKSSTRIVRVSSGAIHCLEYMRPAA